MEAENPCDNVIEMPVVDEKARAFLAKLTPKKIGSPGFNWTKEKDEQLLLGWDYATRKSLAKALGCCESTMLSRYRYLTGKE